MASRRRIRRQVYRAIAEMVEERRRGVVRRASAKLSCEPSTVEAELVEAIDALYRRAGVRDVRQLDLVEWVEEATPRGEPAVTVVQLELFKNA